MSPGLLTAWSFSRYSTYDTCPLQARYKFVDKLPEAPSYALENGASVHNTLSQYIRGDLPANEPVPGWTYFEKLLRELRELEPIVEQEWGYTKEWTPTGWFGNDTWFRSKLDAMLDYEDGDVDVIDFKTGRPREKESAQQAELYFLSIVCRYYHVQRVKVRFWSLDVEQKGKESIYRFDRSMAPEMLKRWTTRAEKMLNDRIMAPLPGQHCKWCSFAKSKGGPCKYG
jgi:CRISPR/Cas system-associated exonuclease Cas4 (RecB family)